MISKFTKATKPLGTTPQDKRYLARNRKLAWLGLWAEVGKYLHATNALRRKEAEEGMVLYYDRLTALGVVTPEEEADEVQPA